MIRKIFLSLVVFPIRIYQYTLSPVMSTLLGMKCRYEPSCSEYMAQAIFEWGAFKGIWMGLKRIGRCHPWGGFGPDPVPFNPKKKNNESQTQKK